MSKRSVTLGSHNCGKSTLARVIINDHLSSDVKERKDESSQGAKKSMIAFVDVDVGVPDRGLPGAISVHILSEISTLRQAGCRSIPLRSRFFGALSPRGNVDRYKAQVTEIMKLA